MKSDFLDDRNAKIKVNNFIGPKFELHTGVPQGSVISPTLFTIYTRDIPLPQTGINIAYADDVTQISGYQGKSKGMLNKRTERQIIALNNFEQSWKIKTNLNKFTPIHLSARNTIPLNINEDLIDFQSDGSSLGLSISRNGYYKHINNRKTKATTALTKLYRLKLLPEHIKIHLVKALVLPVLYYLPIPMNTLSNRQINILQKVQNKALRFATNQRYPFTLTTEAIHIRTKTKPVNVFLHDQANRIWQSLEIINNNTYNNLIDNRQYIRKYHRDFPNSLDKIHQNIIPQYK